MNVAEIGIETQSSHLCSCGKNYRNRDGLWKHKKVCIGLNNTTENEENKKLDNIKIDNYKFVKMLLKENKNLKNVIIEQNTEFKNLILDICKQIHPTNK